MSSSYRRQLSKAVRERRTTYREFVCHLIQLIRDDDDPVRRVDIDEEFLNSLEPAEEMGAITETETTVFQMIVETKTEDDWWANVAKHKFGLSHEDIRSARQIEAEKWAQESGVEGKDESKGDQDRQDESKDS